MGRGFGVKEQGGGRSEVERGWGGEGVMGRNGEEKG